MKHRKNYTITKGTYVDYQYISLERDVCNTIVKAKSFLSLFLWDTRFFSLKNLSSKAKFCPNMWVPLKS